MVDVGMGQNQGIDSARVERKGSVVELLLRLRALEHAAIDQYPMSTRLDHVTGAGDGLRGTVKRDNWLTGHQNTSDKDGRTACRHFLHTGAFARLGKGGWLHLKV